MLLSTIFILVLVLIFCGLFINLYLIFSLFSADEKFNKELRYGLTGLLSFVGTIIIAWYNLAIYSLPADMLFGAITGLSVGILTQQKKDKKKARHIVDINSSVKKNIDFSWTSVFYYTLRLLTYMFIGALVVYFLARLFVFLFPITGLFGF